MHFVAPRFKLKQIFVDTMPYLQIIANCGFEDEKNNGCF